ncbi:MAG TPA: trypsin-like serine protease [Dermatophilaceae bacterium]|nr:trypsin-like serine protease [Dermatophilaceae bacterium]
MPRARHALLATVLAVLTVLGLTAAPAGAITGGQPDGDQHPNVGLIGFYDATGRYRCSATLVTPTVLVTAAHCTADTVGATVVTFQSRLAEAPPSPLPPAADPAKGYVPGVDKLPAGWFFGTAFAHPGYSNFTDLRNWNDVGVVVLRWGADGAPLAGAPALPTSRIATPNQLAAYAQPTLNKTVFTLVGYGTEVRKPESGPQKPQPFSYPLIRRTTTGPGQKLTPQVFQLNGNPNDIRGGGGTCFGDSGGPVLLGGRVVGVTSYGYTDNCRYLGGYQRMDIRVVQDWLATYGVRP